MLLRSHQKDVKGMLTSRKSVQEADGFPKSDAITAEARCYRE